MKSYLNGEQDLDLAVVKLRCGKFVFEEPVVLAGLEFTHGAGLVSLDLYDQKKWELLCRVREDSCKLMDEEKFEDVSNVSKVAKLRRVEDERELQMVNDQQPKIREVVWAEELCEGNGEMLNKWVGDKLNASDDVEAEDMSSLVYGAERD